MPGLFAFTLAQSGKLDMSSLQLAGQRNVKIALGLGQLALDEEALAAAGVYDTKTKVIDVAGAKAKGLVDDATVAQIESSGAAVYDSKGVYGVMITQLMPTGLVGVMVAALLAALMSTVSGALNSISTLFSYDLYKRFKPEATDHQLVFVGRISAAVALLVAIGLVPLLNDYKSIFEGLNEIIAHLAPPVTCVFVLGVFWPRASAKSAKLTLWLGSALGAVVFLLGKVGDMTPVAAWLNRLSGNSFMMIAFYLLCACVAMQVVFSLRWPAGVSERASKLYWSHPLKPLEEKGWPGLGNYKLLTLLLIIAMCTLYYLFR